MSRHVDFSDLTGWDLPAEPFVKLVQAVLAREGVEGSLSLALVDEDTIVELNQRDRDEDGPTDVLSFAYGDEEEWPELEWAAIDEASGNPSQYEAVGKKDLPAELSRQDLGEVVICPAVVERYAAEEGNTLAYQLGWTVVHGVLHLLGYDHEDDNGEMRVRERELLSELKEVIESLVPSDS